jgi:2-methylcitrate dehydratase PrpD
MNAAFVNGVSSHIFDYDDTHLKTIIHPAGPVVSAILALAEYHPVMTARSLRSRPGQITGPAIVTLLRFQNGGFCSIQSPL